jgi:hypothetical protein
VSFEIPDQTDADAMGVEVVVLPPDAEVAPAATLAVGAGDLASPARADVNLAVFRVDAVADDEVISQAIAPFAHVPVIVVHAFGRVRVVGGVVDDNHVPVAAVDPAGRDQLAPVKSGKRFSPMDFRFGPARRRWREYDPMRRGMPSRKQGIR